MVTTSPDVTVSTSLGGWVNRRGVFSAREQADTFREEAVASFQDWTASPRGQHIELGIAENNLFILLGMLGLSDSLFGQRLLPVGTVYDPFIQRGLDALSYACYQDARFLLVATPSGISLAPEGGAHQSIATPLIGMGQDRLAAFEPAFADELAVIMRWGFDYMQSGGVGPDGALLPGDEAGGSVYLRLSTRAVEQPPRELTAFDEAQILLGGYWLIPPAPGSDLAIVYLGAVADEARAAHEAVRGDLPGIGLLAVTSPDRLAAGWRRVTRARRDGDRDARSHLDRLLAPLAPGARLVTVADAHPGSLDWLGSAAGHRCPSASASTTSASPEAFPSCLPTIVSTSTPFSTRSRRRWCRSRAVASFFRRNSRRTGGSAAWRGSLFPRRNRTGRRRNPGRSAPRSGAAASRGGAGAGDPIRSGSR